jgi:hypothetical protein
MLAIVLTVRSSRIAITISWEIGIVNRVWTM